MGWKKLFFCIVAKESEAISKVCPSFWYHKIEKKKLVCEPKIKRMKTRRTKTLNKFWISLLSSSNPCSHALLKYWIPSYYLLHVLMHGHFCKILIFSSLVYDPSFGKWFYFCLWVNNFSFWRISVKFGPGKCYFYLDKRVFIEKMAQICNFWKEKKW